MPLLIKYGWKPQALNGGLVRKSIQLFMGACFHLDLCSTSNRQIPGWWLTYPSEKYDDCQYMEK